MALLFGVEGLKRRDQAGGVSCEQVLLMRRQQLVSEMGPVCVSCVIVGFAETLKPPATATSWSLHCSNGETPLVRAGAIDEGLDTGKRRQAPKVESSSPEPRAV